MPVQVLYLLANKYGVEIPSEAVGTHDIVDGFLDELSLEDRKEILSQYGDAGRVSSFVFVTKEKVPQIQSILPKARALLDIKPESDLWESYPYYDEVEVDHTTRTLRVRFHYLLGSVFYIDETTKTPKMFRQYWRGVVVYRPDRKVMEIRVKHRSMASKMSARIPTYLGLEPFFSVNLMDEKLNRKFIEWINSLNSATIELPISEVSGSIIITARKGMDLRTAEKYHQELKHGRLRHGHITIKPDDNRKINFHIYFRNCHMKYTLLTSETDIDYVIDALERITGGGIVDRSEKLLTEYFGKEI
jgi:hypothetical protein